MQSVYFIKKDSVLSFGKRVYGARVYLSVHGGIQTETVYGSRSFFDGITQQKLGERRHAAYSSNSRVCR